MAGFCCRLTVGIPGYRDPIQIFIQDVLYQTLLIAGGLLQSISKEENALHYGENEDDSDVTG